MYFSCRPVGLEFLDQAPIRVVNSIDLDASPAAVFAVFADGASWPEWYTGIRRVEWTSSLPRGVDTTRTVESDIIAAYERFLAWTPGERFTFRFDGHNRPLFAAIAEDYVLAPLGDGRTRFTYVVAFELRLPLRILGPLVRWRFDRMCKTATVGLRDYLRCR